MHEKHERWHFRSYKAQAQARQSDTATFDIAVLPPTSAAGRQQSHRVYLQVQQWLDNLFTPMDWSWQLIGKELVPVITFPPPAPEKQSHFICCGCKKGCEHNCKCKKSRLACSTICRCLEEVCNNTPSPSITMKKMWMT
uniref:Tesmin/TSO1-like CXC domain-containing protein n=1 Tax=Timema bartmani TaxID=61472 RepID=A0A7R9I143_9NEOP|nr:unnamed protein product [Timema bartmani]